MKNGIKELTVGELLKSTYSELSEKHNLQEVVLPSRALVEIANDFDRYRTRIGYMAYETIGLFEFNKDIWAMARGEAYGDYPATSYNSDILALKFKFKGAIKNKEIKKQIQGELSKSINGSRYFINSLIYGMADGTLVVNKNGQFGQRMFEILRPEIQRFIAQKPEYDSQYLSLSTFSPICKSSAKYKPEFAGFLANSIEAVLD